MKPIKREGMKVMATYPSGVEVRMFAIDGQLYVKASDRLPVRMEQDGTQVPVIQPQGGLQ